VSHPLAAVNDRKLIVIEEVTLHCRLRFTAKRRIPLRLRS
jgi:hypothetical protein